MRGKSSMVRAHWVRLSLIGGGMLLWGEVSAGDITDSMNSYEGVVEAERQTLIAPQVAATVREILVRPGEVVKAGQVMIRLDVQEASQVAAVSAAQVRAAQAVWLKRSRMRIDKSNYLHKAISARQLGIVQRLAFKVPRQWLRRKVHNRQVP